MRVLCAIKQIMLLNSDTAPAAATVADAIISLYTDVAERRKLYSVAVSYLRPPLYSIADLDDLIQDAFMLAWRGRESYRGVNESGRRAEVGSWIGAIVCNLALARIRDSQSPKRDVRKTVEWSDVFARILPDPSPTPEQRVIERERETAPAQACVGRLAGLLSVLTPAEREVTVRVLNGGRVGASQKASHSRAMARLRRTVRVTVTVDLSNTPGHLTA